MGATHDEHLCRAAPCFSRWFVARLGVPCLVTLSSFCFASVSRGGLAGGSLQRFARNSSAINRLFLVGGQGLAPRPDEQTGVDLPPLPFRHYSDGGNQE